MLALVSTACCVTICRKPYKTILYYIHMKVEMMHLVIELCVCLVLKPAIQSVLVLWPPYFYFQYKIANAVFAYSKIRQLVVEILK